MIDPDMQILNTHPQQRIAITAAQLIRWPTLAGQTACDTFAGLQRLNEPVEVPLKFENHRIRLVGKNTLVTVSVGVN